MESTRPALGTDPRNPPAALDDYEDKGAHLWHAVLSRYSLRVDELVVLEQACRCVDDIERLRLALKDADLTVLGSMKQTVANPLLSEIRGLRTTLASLIKQLGLPDELATSGASKSPQHQRAAHSRWARRDAAVAAQHARADEAAI
jgi:hypothetical protein